MELLERQADLAQLSAAWADARSGSGRIVLVSGEAGIGKTSLVQGFTRSRVGQARVLWGACDALFSPRPLGPLYDIAAQLQGDLPRLLALDANRSQLYAAVLAELKRGPVILVFEDVHWADEASLDLLRYLVRRITSAPALLILTYRDDELDPRHPLRLVLGDLAATPWVKRILLPPLSEAAVRTLVGGQDLDATALHHKTGGNPFFVTEVLANEGGGIPATVRDAVLARAARLSQHGRAALEAAAVLGMRVEPALLVEAAGAEASATEEVISAGMLLAQGDMLLFRHELARQTVLEAISPPRRHFLHRRALEALKTSPSTGDLALLAHHAEAAGDRQAVLEFAPAAARQASAAGAHRQAAALYALALRFAGSLTLAERAALLEAHAWESNLIDQGPETLSSRRQAIELWRQAGNPLKQGNNLAELALSLFGSGSEGEAMRTSQEAIQVLESLPPGRELALAYRTKALLHAFNHDYTEAISLAEKAVELAERFGDVRVLAMAYDTLGTTWLYVDYARGSEILKTCLNIAQKAGLEARVATVYGNWGATASDLFRLDDAMQYLTKGIEYSAEHDMDLIHMHLLAWQALTGLYLGRWSEAEEIVSKVIPRADINSINRIPALVALGRLRARQGDPDPRAALDEAMELAVRASAFQNMGPVRAARAEAAWLAGDRQLCLEEARAVYPQALDRRHPWLAGELAFWLWKCGDEPGVTAWMAPPFALHITGDWRAAAQAWEQIGCPYEQARALADGDTQARTAALHIFERLGAWPAAEALLRQLQASGDRKQAHKPRSATRENPFGLTSRQVQILALLVEGLSNAEIAARLFISPKTTDHHVSAVLARLDVHSREDAAALARQHPYFNKI